MKKLINVALGILDKPIGLSESIGKQKPINDQIFELISHIGSEQKTDQGDRIIDVLHEFHDMLDELRSKYDAGKLSAKELATAVFSIEPKLHKL